MDSDLMTQLKEGGNVFKNNDGKPVTQRINQTDVKPTLAWLEEMLPGLDLQNNMLGSTGLKPTSGDIDLNVDAGQVSKEQLVARLSQWAQSHGFKPQDYVRKSGNAVHFLTPITGRPDQGYVQTDFMFSNNPTWSSFFMRSGADSAYKGVDRAVLLSSIAKPLGYKINTTDGVIDRNTGKVVTADPDEVARLLLTRSATAEDLSTVETIVAALARDPKRDVKLADARAHFEKNNMPFPGEVAESQTEPLYQEVNDVYFLARLRDRIVNQGMIPLVEAANPRIEHLEDLVFEQGSRGIKTALEIIQHSAENTGKSVTVKWDGKPAIVFGRKPTGEFVLTDKSGFTAKGYDGLATSPEMMAQIQRQRGGERTELIEIYNRLFPMLQAATPPNFKGYVQGDLLYTEQPPEISGEYIFKPNFVEYKIPASSPLGQRIGSSEVAVATHTRYSEAGGTPEALGTVNFKEVPGLLLIEPTVKNITNITPNANMVKQLKSIAYQHGAEIDGLFNPAELRAAQVTDLPQLCKRYINSRIDTNYDNLLPDFGAWLQKSVTPRKYNNIIEYIQSPRSNLNGISSAFTAFLMLHDLKTDLLSQLDRQQPGQEGWVMATPAGRAKLVNRFGFSAGNRAQNNPEQVPNS
jgi:hypothetical protein